MLLNNTKRFALLCAAVLLNGCIDRKISITINTDGSGTLEYQEHFDRADSELRKKIKKHLASSNMKSPLDENKIPVLLPAPNFKVVSYSFDKVKLHRKIIVKFKDINELLAKEQAKAFNIDGLDFKRTANSLTFTLQTKTGRKVRPNGKTGRKLEPPRLTLTIVNSATGDKVSHFQEENGNEIPEWQAQLPFKNASFKRTIIAKLFKNLPTAQSGIPELVNASWHIREGRFAGSKLKIDLTVPFKVKQKTNYLSWRDPVIISGLFNDGVSPEFDQMSSKNGRFVDNQNKPSEGSFFYGMALKRPSKPATQLSDLKIRFLVETAHKTETKLLPKAEKGAKVEIDGAVYTLNEISDKTMSLKITKKTMRLAKVFQKSASGNQFELKPSRSSVFGGSETVNFTPMAEVTGSTFYIEAYTDTKQHYLDMSLPALELLPKPLNK